jgi:transposase InsO family protein
VIRFIDQMRARGFRVEPVCRVLSEYGVKIAARTYRAFKSREPSARAARDAEVVSRMRELRETPDEAGGLPYERLYGQRKMTRLLRREGFEGLAFCTVGRLMRQEGMSGLVKGRKRKTTTRKRREPYAGDLLKRVFDAPAPDWAWVTDMTYVRAASGWVYVAFMVDVFSRMIVGWGCSERITVQLASEALRHALWNREAQGHPVADGLIHHSDHGSQYTSVRYGEQMELSGIRPSFGTVGDCYDNALAESVNSLYKAECVEQEDRLAGVADVAWHTARWVEWHNNRRIHEALSYQTPAEVEQAYYAEHQAGNQTGEPLQTTAATNP